MQGNATRIAVITRLTIVWRTRKIASHGGGGGKGESPSRERVERTGRDTRDYAAQSANERT